MTCDKEACREMQRAYCKAVARTNELRGQHDQAHQSLGVAIRERDEARAVIRRVMDWAIALQPGHGEAQKIQGYMDGYRTAKGHVQVILATKGAP